MQADGELVLDFEGAISEFLNFIRSDLDVNSLEGLLTIRHQRFEKRFPALKELADVVDALRGDRRYIFLSTLEPRLKEVMNTTNLVSLPGELLQQLNAQFAKLFLTLLNVVRRSDSCLAEQWLYLRLLTRPLGKTFDEADLAAMLEGILDWVGEVAVSVSLFNCWQEFLH
jgi:hypothetical protein